MSSSKLDMLPRGVGFRVRGLGFSNPQPKPYSRVMSLVADTRGTEKTAWEGGVPRLGLRQINNTGYALITNHYTGDELIRAGHGAIVEAGRVLLDPIWGLTIKFD